MDKKYVIGSGIDYKEVNALPELHIQRKKQPKLLDLFTAQLGQERGLKLFKTEVGNLFQSKFTGRSDYDKVKREIARKIFLYNLSKLRSKKPQGAQEKSIPLNLTIAKF